MNAMLPIFAGSAKADKSADIVAAARAFAPHLSRSRVLDRKLVANTMTLCFGGTDAEGLWSWRDAYDAIEVATVLQMRRLAPQIGRVEDAPAEIAAMLAQLTDLTLTHTRRSEEQVELDQFSTPPALAVLAAAAAQIRPGDLVLEPSAGTGLLAVCAEACGATLHLNEFSEHRARLLDAIFQCSARTRHDAAHLPDLVKASGSFHAVLTNPPFQHLGAHLCASLAALADGGRMAAIVPLTALNDSGLLKSLTRNGEVVGALGVPGRAFAKHGTSVETAILVVDRKPGGVPWEGSPQHFESLADLARAIASLPPRPTAQTRRFREVAMSSVLSPKARELATPSNRLKFLASTAPVEYETHPFDGEGHDVGIYQAYRLSRVAFTRQTPHPSPLVESASMAAVPLPAPTYRPSLPVAMVENALVSDAQMEVAVYAGEAHSRMLPGWWRLNEAEHEVELVPEGQEGAFQFRCGFFVGDGTGVGKGRETATVIADNMAQGRTRAVWISKNPALLEDARRDWVGIGGVASDVTPQWAWKQGDGIRMDRGILFTTYATLRQPARGDKKSRLHQIVDWLGKDFDGVIAMDEAHGLANAAGGGEGKRGPKRASLQGQAGLALQNLLPNARVLYVSATGATQPQNLAYASRLGLWGGPEAPFMNREAFLAACDAGGTCVMELVARELKAMGLYIARSLSFEGVEYEPLRHTLTPEDIELWNSWADAFQIIHNNLQHALQAVGITDDDGKTTSGQAKSAVMSAFEGSKLRFFGHLLAGLKAPTLIAEIRRVLEAGQSAVVQIVSTNEAVMERRLANIPAEEWNNLSIDLTPKEYVLDYLQEAFPVTKLQIIEDDDGNVTATPLLDDSGRPVVCQEALAIRDDLVTQLACLPAVPSVLDSLIDHLGPDNVAEVTGRSRRVVLRDGRRVVERRGSSAAKAETDAFMAGRKRVLVFSDAGGTGRSYHADLNCGNTQKRIHFLVEPGWRADAAVQGLGRTHRTNQAHPPLFRPVTTDIQGEKRFLSTIARRLDSLGALTRGERRTAGNGLFSADDNLESPYARQALQVLYSNLVWGEGETSMPLDEFEAKTGLRLLDNDGAMKPAEQLPPMNTFLNRVLALRIADQNAIFKDLEAILQSILERAAANGSLDRGVEDIVADDVRIVSEGVLRTDVITGAETRLLSVETRVKRPIMSADAALQWVANSSHGYGLYVNKRSGGAAVVQTGHTFIGDDNRLVKAVKFFRPTESHRASEKSFNESAWTQVDEPIWRATWDAEVAATDPYTTRSFALVTGLLLPIWSKLPSARAYVRRLKAPDGRRWLGRVLELDQVTKLRAELGLTDLATLASEGADVLRMVMTDGAQIEIGSGMWLRRVRVMDTPRLEVINGRSHLQALKSLGAQVEIIHHAARVFVPLANPDALTRILKQWPAVSMITGAAA